ncbi:hypothetical protein PO81_20610 [Vibrio parahaemolyticus]|nr:hypothetical protein PO81_20610 [Vibrio parahaemolyticus]
MYVCLYLLVIVCALNLFKLFSKSIFYADFLLSWELWLFLVPVAGLVLFISNIKSFKAQEPKKKHMLVFNGKINALAFYYKWRFRLYSIFVNLFYVKYVSPKLAAKGDVNNNIVNGIIKPLLLNLLVIVEFIVVSSSAIIIMVWEPTFFDFSNRYFNYMVNSFFEGLISFVIMYLIGWFTFILTKKYYVDELFSLYENNLPKEIPKVNENVEIIEVVSENT